MFDLLLEFHVFRQINFYDFWRAIVKKNKTEIKVSFNLSKILRCINTFCNKILSRNVVTATNSTQEAFFCLYWYTSLYEGKHVSLLLSSIKLIQETLQIIFTVVFSRI